MDRAQPDCHQRGGCVRVDPRKAQLLAFASEGNEEAVADLFHEFNLATHRVGRWMLVPNTTPTNQVPR